jgi:molybdenum cofactor cytidylyltransferase
LKFGQCRPDEAVGCILAHSLGLSSGVIRKGTRLEPTHIERMVADGLDRISVARLDAGDLGEDEAAERIGECLRAPGLATSPVFTGRVNLVAERAGIVAIDVARIDAMNAVHEGLTLATLAPMMRVSPDQLVATVKVIPYGLPETAVRDGVSALGSGAISLHPFVGGSAKLIMTRTPGFKESLLKKGEAILRERVGALGYTLSEVVVVPHEEDAVAEALTTPSKLTLILGASATSDRSDVAPAAVMKAGGRILRFGMPVDPGNLLFLGDLRGDPVVGLPGCARSPALNGVDWVLERLAAGLPVTDGTIAGMGVGGLLKEMPGRPQPRREQRKD